MGKLQLPISQRRGMSRLHYTAYNIITRCHYRSKPVCMRGVGYLYRLLIVQHKTRHAIKFTPCSVRCVDLGMRRTAAAADNVDGLKRTAAAARRQIIPELRHYSRENVTASQGSGPGPTRSRVDNRTGRSRLP